jgi:serpin B
LDWKVPQKFRMRIFPKKSALELSDWVGVFGDKSNCGTGGPMRRLKKALFVPLIVAFVLSACSSLQPKPQVAKSNLPRNLSPQMPASDLTELVSGNNDFAFAFYHQISSGDANLFYSPYSISIALAMTYAGAGGDTAGQMAQAMNFTLPAERLHPAFDELALALDSRSHAEGLKPGVFQLNVANSLWGQSGFHFEQGFLDALALNYAAGMRLVNYRKNPEAARRAINDWVSQSTNQRIKDIIPPGALDALTRLVLANAVYFKAAWQNSFDPSITKPDAFHLPGGGSVQIDMMHESARLPAMQGDGYLAAELPYAGGELSMVVLLPDEGRFSDLETRLNAGLIAETMAVLHTQEVVVTLPKFKLEWSSELSKGLKALGLTDAFSPSLADFSGMNGARDLYISRILHKTFVSVDEQGTEAAAASAVMMEAMAPPGKPVEPFQFKVDRPFFFLIRDNPTGTILFVGRVTNPAG